MTSLLSKSKYSVIIESTCSMVHLVGNPGDRFSRDIVISRSDWC